MTLEELDAIEAAARAPMSFDRPKINCTHDEERGHAPWCFACEQADRASRPVPFERRGRADVLALIAEVRRLTAERDASVAAMRDIAEVVGVPYMGAVGLAGAVRMERDAAFARGAEAMREAAAKACESHWRGCERELARALADVANDIRALPTPTDETKETKR